MASLRGGQLLYGTSNDDGTYTPAVVGQNDASGWAVVGPGPYVAIYIDNQGATGATFDVEVAANDDPRAGLNWLDTSDPDGGVTWYKYQGATALVVAAGSTACYDIAPFSPPLVRLVRTDATGDDDVVALVSSFGSN